MGVPLDNPGQKLDGVYFPGPRTGETISCPPIIRFTACAARTDTPLSVFYPSLDDITQNSAPPRRGSSFSSRQISDLPEAGCGVFRCRHHPSVTTTEWLLVLAAAALLVAPLAEPSYGTFEDSKVTR